MLEEFEKYISSYSLDQSYMKLKHDHSIRVMELMGKYAKELGFSEEDIENTVEDDATPVVDEVPAA